MRPAGACDLCGGLRAVPVLEKNGARYVECPDCGFVYSDSSLQEAEADNEHYFSEALQRYAEKAEAPRKRQGYRRILKRLERHRGAGRLLEVGCNVGAFLAEARNAGWSATGVEPVATCAEYGRERFGLDIRPSTLEVAGLPADSLDVVYSNAVFEHLPSPSTVLYEVARVLRPGGVVLIDTVNWDSYTRRRLGGQWKLIDPRVHVSLFTSRTLAGFARRAGLQVVRIATHGVRLRPNHAAKLTGLSRFLEEVAKLPWSIATRFTQRGDSIELMARKP